MNHQQWICTICETQNPSISFSLCARCGFPNTSIALPPSNIPEEIYQHPIPQIANTNCSQCKKVILPSQPLFCISCGGILSKTEYQNSVFYCAECNIKNQNDMIICFDCSENFWTCMSCKSKSNLPNCPKCKYPKGSKFNKCTKCQVTTPIDQPCWSCEYVNTPLIHCSVCGENQIKNICGCSYSFTCGICKESKKFLNVKLCWKCGKYIKDGVCESELVPRKWVVCEDCFPKPSEIKRFNQEFPIRIDRQIEDKALCFMCGRHTNDYFNFCWLCSNKRYSESCMDCGNDNPICRGCLSGIERCDDCNYAIINNQCYKCEKISMPKLVEANVRNEYQENFWECFSCNYFNKPLVLFCERCNMNKDYSFTEKFICDFCGKFSHEKLCKSCFKVTSCSLCEKDIFTSQKIHCGECGKQLSNQKCKNCGEFRGLNQSLCKFCAYLVNKCKCGNTKHPKSVYCRFCRIDQSFGFIKCFDCDLDVWKDMCTICGNYGSNSCLNCKELDKNYMWFSCRNCILSKKKCKNCFRRIKGKKCGYCNLSTF